MTRKADTTALAQRIERVFMDISGKGTPRGARAWIARLARLHPMSVSRMLTGELPPDRIEATLDAIEMGRRSAAQPTRRAAHDYWSTNSSTL